MNRPSPTTWAALSRTLSIVLLGLLLAEKLAGAQDSSAKSLSLPHAAATVLRIAHSDDGLRFEDSGRSVAQRASSPDVIQLKDGAILALFDTSKDEGESPATRTLVIRSTDDGRTWSMPRAIRLDGPGARAMTPRHADLERLPDGRLRLYFTAGNTPNPKHDRPWLADTVWLRSATTTNGLLYQVDPISPARFPKGSDPIPVAVAVGARVHLFVAGAEPPTQMKPDSGVALQHLISRDGRRFAAVSPGSLPDVDRLGSIVNLERGLRAYASGPDGIGSFSSRDGRNWRAEDGLRFPRGHDPAVTRLRDGTYLMLYCDTPESAHTESLAATDSAPISAELDWAAEPALWTDTATPESPAIAGAETAKADAASDQGDGIAVVPSDGSDPPATGTTPAQQVDGTGLVHEAPAETPDWRERWDPVASGGFAPKPEFDAPVDYLDWYQEFGREPVQDDAVDAYLAFLPTLQENSGATDDAGIFHDMFNDENYAGPPGPWDAQQHPDWVKASDAARDFHGRFEEASKHSGYATPAHTGHPPADGLPDGARLLLGLELPHLQPHRQMVKSLLAGAWRMGDDGKVDVERMLSAWRTALRAAGHLTKGSTLIENLVGINESSFVEENARWALQHGLFDEAQLAEALNTLRDFDNHEPDLARSLRGEHGAVMDLTQYLFSPPDAQGRPKVNTERLDALMKNDFIGAAPAAGIARMTPDGANTTLEAFDRHYRNLAAQMQMGYPDVRAADIQALELQVVRTSPLTETFMPSLSRYYKLLARHEASRRATQLVYAVHLFRAREGRWPASLAELPREIPQLTRVDPFTGLFFGYRLTDDGPVIYSHSENGLDDGGVHSPRWDDEPDSATGSDDHVFWPPQHNVKR